VDTWRRGEYRVTIFYWFRKKYSSGIKVDGGLKWFIPLILGFMILLCGCIGQESNNNRTISPSGGSLSSNGSGFIPTPTLQMTAPAENGTGGAPQITPNETNLGIVYLHPWRATEELFSDSDT
jgi:hypothetical protein